MMRTTGRMILGDDVGLGKSASALYLLDAADALPALVVTLTHLPEQWLRELAMTRQVLPDLVVAALAGQGGGGLLRARAELLADDVVSTSTAQLAAVLGGEKPRSVTHITRGRVQSRMSARAWRSTPCRWCWPPDAPHRFIREATAVREKAAAVSER